MNKNGNIQKPRVGLFLIASSRFKNIEIVNEENSYEARQNKYIHQWMELLAAHVDIVNPGIIYSPADAESAISNFICNKVDCIIAEYLSWAEDSAWIRFLRDMPDMPVLFITRAEKSEYIEDTMSEEGFVQFLCSSSLVGSLEASGAIKRLGRPGVKIAVGDRENLKEEIIHYCAAAKVRSILRQSNFGLLAGYNPLMWSTYIDPYNLFTRIGPELAFISHATLSDEIRSISDSDAKRYCDELAYRFPVMNDVDDVFFLESARASIGLERIAANHHLDALVFNDVDPAMLELVGLRPGFYGNWFNENNAVLVPEADIGGGVITLILKLLSRKHVSFIEPFYMQTAKNTFVAGHGGPHDYDEHSGKMQIARDIRFVKSSLRYAGAPFGWHRIPPGRKTMAHFSEENGVYKMVCTIVDAVEGQHFIAGYSHGEFEPHIPVKELFDSILNIGTTQHFAVVDGDYCQELSDLSCMMGFKYTQI